KGKFQRALDVGAGDGNVTKQLKMSNIVNEIWCTEVSKGMVSRLREEGYTCIETDSLDCEELKNKKFNLILLLNVIDRCSKPITLLKQCKNMLMDEDSRLVVAVPLDSFEPFVEQEDGSQIEPEEFIMHNQKNWEKNAICLVCIHAFFSHLHLDAVFYFIRI